MKKQRKKKSLGTPLSHEEQEDFETRNLLLPYIPPRRMDVSWVSIPSKGYAALVVPKIPKGMTILHDIVPKLQKLNFEDSETRKLRDLDRKNYMKLVRDMPDSPNQLVAMKWEKGIE